jgi:arginyl-tRNA synthetase
LSLLRFVARFEPIQVIKLISPAWFLRTQITNALSRMFENYTFEISVRNAVLDSLDITVKPCFEEHRNLCRHYTCAIAFSLAHQLGRSLLEVAQTLAESIRELVSDRFQVEVAGEGWLNFTLRDCVIAECLVNLSQALETRIDNTPTTGLPRSPINFSGYSYVQYSYARCGALMRLAQKVELADNLQIFSWQLLDPDGVLYLRITTEQRLAFYLLAIADEIVRNSINFKEIDCSVGIKLSKNLATNFLDFYNSCRILSADRELALARIGLISTTKKAIAYLVASQIFLPESL